MVVERQTQRVHRAFPAMSRLLATIVGIGVAWSTLAAVPEPTPIGPPPDALPSDLARGLAAQGLAVALDGGTVAEFWLRGEVVAREDDRSALGAELSRIERGALLGVVRFAKDWSDYKGSRVRAGTYALRYAVRPDDGNHMGVSVYRDFAILIPAEVDPGVDTVALDALIEGGRRATGTTHPASLALFPVPEGTDLPAVVRNEIDHWTLAARVGTFRIGFMLQGEGEH